MKMVKTFYYYAMFSKASDKKSKWNVIHEKWMAQKLSRTGIDVAVNWLNEQFVKIVRFQRISVTCMLTFVVLPQYSLSFRCVAQFAIGFANLDSLLLKALLNCLDYIRWK